MNVTNHLFSLEDYRKVLNDLQSTLGAHRIIHALIEEIFKKDLSDIALDVATICNALQNKNFQPRIIMIISIEVLYQTKNIPELKDKSEEFIVKLTNWPVSFLDYEECLKNISEQIIRLDSYNKQEAEKIIREIKTLEERISNDLELIEETYIEFIDCDKKLSNLKFDTIKSIFIESKSKLERSLQLTECNLFQDLKNLVPKIKKLKLAAQQKKIKELYEKFSSMQYKNKYLELIQMVLCNSSKKGLEHSL